MKEDINEFIHEDREDDQLVSIDDIKLAMEVENG